MLSQYWSMAFSNLDNTELGLNGRNHIQTSPSRDEPKMPRLGVDEPERLGLLIPEERTVNQISKVFSQ
jgi:hypothetical protein